MAMSRKSCGARYREPWRKRHQRSVIPSAAQVADPALIGKPGSFFKNPIVPQHSACIAGAASQLQLSASDGSFKLAAGW